NNADGAQQRGEVLAMINSRRPSQLFVDKQHDEKNAAKDPTNGEVTKTRGDLRQRQRHERRINSRPSMAGAKGNHDPRQEEYLERAAFGRKQRRTSDNKGHKAEIAPDVSPYRLQRYEYWRCDKAENRTVDVWQKVLKQCPFRRPQSIEAVFMRPHSRLT